jgi:hypothetical protein
MSKVIPDTPVIYCSYGHESSFKCTPRYSEKCAICASYRLSSQRQFGTKPKRVINKQPVKQQLLKEYQDE